MMNFKPISDAKIRKDRSDNWMLDFLSCFYRFDFGINNTMLMLKKGWQMTAANITIFIDGSGQNTAAILMVPLWVIGPTTKK